MQDHNTHKSTDDDELPIKVIRGEAKPSSGKKRKILLGLMSLVLVVGLGSTGYLYSQDKTDKETLDSQLAESESSLNSIHGQLDEKTADTAERVESKQNKPKEYKQYTDSGNKFVLDYPASWKGIKPSITPVKDYKIKPIDNVTVQYSSESKKWIISEAEGAPYTKGDAYMFDIARKDREVTVYRLNQTNESCMISILVFIENDNAIELKSPQVCQTEENDKKLEDLDRQVEEIAFSIKLQ